MNGGEEVPEISRINLNGNLIFSEKKPWGWQFVCSGSNEGINWDELGMVREAGLPGQEK
jgi:hypothetical protein